MRKEKSLLQKINGLIRQARVPLYLHHFESKKYTTWQHCKLWLLQKNPNALVIKDEIPHFFSSAIASESPSKKTHREIWLELLDK